MLVPSNDAAGGLLFAGLHEVEEAGEKTDSGIEGDSAITVGLSVVRANMTAPSVPLTWSIDDYRTMVAAGLTRDDDANITALRSAVARATYQGCRVRLQRAEEPPKRKKAKAKTD